MIQLQMVVKRLIDIVVSAVALALFLPVMLVIAIVVKVTSPGEVIFRQWRGGKNGRLFTIYKFRTMTKDAPNSALGSYAYKDDPRITSVGKFLRRTSLDELPQLFNVLRGDMSIVGPRPDLPHHVEKYTRFQRQRLLVKPGITGWAQVRGRNQISWDARIKLDVEYVQRWSLVRDLDVILRTGAVVLTGKGASLPMNVGDVPSFDKTDAI